MNVMKIVPVDDPDLDHVDDPRPVRQSTRGAPLFDTGTQFPTERGRMLSIVLKWCR